MANTLISQKVRVNRRYTRSVEIERDFNDSDALDGYILTPTARDGLSRIISGLNHESSHRAFRITGAYGSGKSAFGLFLANLFEESNSEGPAQRIVQGRMGSISVPLYHPVAIVGNRSSISKKIVDSLIHSTESVLGSNNEIFQKIRNKSKKIDVKETLDVIVELSNQYYEKTGKKLLLLIDEFGRFIEYAASNPSIEDPSIFQMLAERACGNPKSNFAVIVFLHHRFSDYVASMGEWIENEWSRSSERYEEITFNESSEQILHLISQAISPINNHSKKVITKSISLYEKAEKIGLFATKGTDFNYVAQKLYPLHPTAIACLIIATTKYGQNERSVFSFLQSSEPSGFQRFAGEKKYCDSNWYQICDLFDYFASQGQLQFKTNSRERQWQLAQDSILMNPDLTEIQIKVLKSLAIISVLEPIPGLNSNNSNISWALGISENLVIESISELKKRGLVHDRSSKGDYCLWAHSSVDLENWLERAKISVPSTGTIDEQFLFDSPIRPLVAQRHYHLTGNLRTFEVVVFSNSLNKPSKETNCVGKIVILPNYPEESYERSMSMAKETSKKLGKLSLVKLQKISSNHIDFTNNLKWWRWIHENCKELRIDDFARSEVNSQINYFSNLLKKFLISFVDVSNGADSADWYYNGRKITINTRSDLVSRLSKICDEVYFDAPILRNELINHDRLSAPVSAARLRLMEQMLINENSESLGIKGYPAEYTIYLSMFKASGLHRIVNKEFRFTEPTKNDPMKWKPSWKYIESLVSGSETVSFKILLEKLAEPPIGLKSGPALLLIVAYLISTSKSTILMERNTFQPDVNSAHFTRLAKSPKNFALKHIKNTDDDEFLRNLINNISIWNNCPPAPDIKSMVSTLFKWWGNLSPFAKQTQQISPIAKKVRAVLRKANEPIDLIYRQLPEVCGTMKSNEIDKENYALFLDSALSELECSLPLIQDLAKKRILSAFGEKSLSKLRNRIKTDFKDHLILISNYELRAFIERAIDMKLSDDLWIDRITGLVVGSRIENWDDKQLDKFDYEIRMFSDKLNRLLFAIRNSISKKSPITAVHITDSLGNEGSFFSHSNPQLNNETLNKIKELLYDENHPKELIVELVREYIEETERELEK